MTNTFSHRVIYGQPLRIRDRFSKIDQPDKKHIHLNTLSSLKNLSFVKLFVDIHLAETYIKNKCGATQGHEKKM